MSFVWIGEKMFVAGATDFHLPDWVSYVILGVLFVGICGLVFFMFSNSRASAIINCVFMAINVFLLFFSFAQKKFVNPRVLQLANFDAFKHQNALGVWVWEGLIFAIASLSITANVHTFITDGRYEQIYIDQHGRVGTETKGLDETQKTWITFGVILAVSLGVVALGLYKNMWWIQAYSLAWLGFSIIQIIVTCKLHDKLDF